MPDENMSELPEAWQNLIQAVTLLARGQSNVVSPFHCEHGELSVMSAPAAFTAVELAQLAAWGFVPASDGDYFTSFRYGSA